MKYVFLGTHSIVGDLDLNHFAQVVDLAEEAVQEARAGRCVLIPLEDFEAILAKNGLKLADMSKFGSVASHADAPEAFKLAKRQAIERYAEIASGKPDPATPAPQNPGDLRARVLGNAERRAGALDK